MTTNATARRVGTQNGWIVIEDAGGRLWLVNPQTGHRVAYRRSATILHDVCAWCDAERPFNIPAGTAVSHGVCERHAAEVRRGFRLAA